MNVYDFDKTIYYGDSTADFYLFCLKRHKKILTLAPSILGAFLKFYVFKIFLKEVHGMLLVGKNVQISYLLRY